VGHYTIAIIKPNFHMVEVSQYIKQVFEENGFTCHFNYDLKAERLSKEQAIDLYSGLRGKEYQDKPVQFILNGFCVVMVWYHPGDAVAIAKQLVGPTYALQAMQEDCIRGFLLEYFGTAQEPYFNAANFIHVPGDDVERDQQMEAIFGVAKAKQWQN